MALVKYNNNSISDITTAGQVATGSLVLIKTLTASGSATLSFVHGTDGVVLDSTYPIYRFEFINIHPATDNTKLEVVFRDGGTAYDAVKTSTHFSAYHAESDADVGLGYQPSMDLAQSSGGERLNYTVGNDNDQNICGEMFLYNPSSTTFVKHYMATILDATHDNYSITSYVAGYCNVTALIDGVQFTMSSGNIDSGKIKLYGIKDS